MKTERYGERSPYVLFREVLQDLYTGGTRGRAGLTGRYTNLTHSEALANFIQQV
jgi:hypothetical protein